MAEKFSITKLGYWIAGLVLSVLAGALIWVAVKGLEGEAPTLQWEQPIHFIGESYTLKGLAYDQKSGVKRLWIAIQQQGREVVLADQSFPSEGLFPPTSVPRQPISLDINIRELGLTNGEAILKTSVWDRSFRGWFSGNQSYAEHRVIIDTQPPNVEVLTQNHNLNQGGAGLAVYRTSEPVSNSGVQVGDRFFPGSSGYFTDPSLFLVLFAVPYDEDPHVQIHVTATDHAGNAARAGLLYHINTKHFEAETVQISDTFLAQKMPELQGLTGGIASSASLDDIFVAVNRDLREVNHKILEETCKQSDPEFYWTGRFQRLPASAQTAGFADQRQYEYHGRVIDNQVHLGVDLASTVHSPVPAANRGRIAFAGDLGIYGNTIVMDHGFGLFSMYGHLSRIQVTTDQVVSKGDIIGFTGNTGLAGGDHLHFSMLIHDTFVNPVEWWDSQWIEHNVTDKLTEIKAMGENA